MENIVAFSWKRLFMLFYLWKVVNKKWKILIETFFFVLFYLLTVECVVNIKWKISQPFHGKGFLRFYIYWTVL